MQCIKNDVNYLMQKIVVQDVKTNRSGAGLKSHIYDQLNHMP